MSQPDSILMGIFYVTGASRNQKRIYLFLLCLKVQLSGVGEFLIYAEF